MRRYLLLLVLAVACTSALMAQKVVTGTVTDASTKEALIGASVLVKGTNQGTATDIDGKYRLENVKEGAVLQISYVGMETVEEVVGNRTVVDVALGSGALNLNEVVVTAMGIERKAKSLTYATQKVNGSEFVRAKETNMINSLQGKAAGVVITPNSSGAGGSSKIVIRGNKSAQGNNQALIVIDGVPMSNNSMAQVESVYGGRDAGDALSNLNPDDIASINVLKGASAAALYGSQAANGVVLVTTKKGSSGRVRVDFTSNVTIETALDKPEIQSRYGASVLANGSLDTNSWGEKISKGVDASSDFFRTGATFINSVAVSGGTDKIQSYMSYANTTAEGIMPTNDFKRHNIMFKQTYKLLNDRLTLSGSANYITQKGNNRPRGGQYQNPLTGLYTFPANGDWNYYKNTFEVYNDVKQYSEQQWYRDTNNDFSQNPYWILNRVKSEETRNRTMVSGSARFDITDYLFIQGRLSYDRINDRWARTIHASTSQVLANPNGEYQEENYMMRTFYGDIMVNFNKTFGDYSVSAAVGSSFNDYKQENENLNQGGDRYLPNFWDIANSTKNGSSKGLSRKRLNAVFATAQIGWKDMLFLDVTGRNDWSSTLAFTPNGSYFYPSVGLTGVISDMVKMPEVINQLKARATYSIVGNEMPVYITNPLNGFANGSISFNTSMPFTDMKPEKLHSMEFGIDASMFDDRFNFDITYYLTNNKNQYFSMSVPSATGYSSYYFNAGNIQNSGVELTASWTQRFTKDFAWKTQVNFSYNNNKIKELDNREGISEADRLDKVDIGSMYGLRSWLVEGGKYGDIYAQNFIRDAKTGLICVNADGKIQYADEFEKVGNVNADVRLGWGNTFTYKDFSLYFLIDGSIGGNFFDMTQASLDMYGVSENSAKARDNGGVEVFNTASGQVEKMDAKSFYTAIGSINGGSGDYYAYSQTNFRLRELSIGYTFRDLLGSGHDLSLSAIARNLFFLYKDCPSDPDTSMSTSNGYAGMGYYRIPNTRSFGLNLKLSF